MRRRGGGSSNGGGNNGGYEDRCLKAAKRAGLRRHNESDGGNFVTRGEKGGRCMKRQVGGGGQCVIATEPHKSQKLIFKNKLLQIVQVIASKCYFILSKIRLFYLAVTFNVVNNIYCFK